MSEIHLYDWEAGPAEAGLTHEPIVLRVNSSNWKLHRILAKSQVLNLCGHLRTFIELC